MADKESPAKVRGVYERDPEAESGGSDTRSMAGPNARTSVAVRTQSHSPTSESLMFA